MGRRRGQARGEERGRERFRGRQAGAVTPRRNECFDGGQQRVQLGERRVVQARMLFQQGEFEASLGHKVGPGRQKDRGPQRFGGPGHLPAARLEQAQPEP